MQMHAGLMKERTWVCYVPVRSLLRGRPISARMVIGTCRCLKASGSGGSGAVRRVTCYPKYAHLNHSVSGSSTVTPRRTTIFLAVDAVSLGGIESIIVSVMANMRGGAVKMNAFGLAIAVTR